MSDMSPFLNRVKWYTKKGRLMYMIQRRLEGKTYREIAEMFDRTPERIRQSILRSKKYKTYTYTETRDVYADFKKHYDEVMAEK